jgi:serine/threonine protein kinase
MPGLEGTRLGAYELIERVGEGGMADVYRARQLTAFGREVALKVIRPEFTGDEPFRRRFLREAHAISRLSHPHILPLIEFGDERGLLYLVMPLVREGTLRDLLQHHSGPLPLEEAIPLFTQLCDAVQYAHQEGIIHRDIKPQNILLQRYTHVLLADFGIARDRFDTKMTSTGAGIGTVEYMAPEQAGGRTDARSDIYSLGVVFYQMITGALPHTGTTPLQVLIKKENDAAPDPRKYTPTLPTEIAEILQVALASDPGQRFESAGALGNAVQQVNGSPAYLDADAPSTLPAHSPAHVQTRLQTRLAQPPLEEQETAPSQNFGSAPTERLSSFVLAPTLREIRLPSSYEQQTVPETEGWAANTPGESLWTSPPTWGSQNIMTPPGAGETTPPRRRQRGLLVAALVAAAVLAIGLSSIAYGHLGLAWLHPGGANTGILPATPTPGISIQPTHIALPTTPTIPQPASTPAARPTATPAPADTPTSAPTATPTPAPTDTPMPQPTATPMPAPTPAPTAQPTATPAPQPTATPTPAPADTPTPSPGSAPAPGATVAPSP